MAVRVMDSGDGGVGGDSGDGSTHNSSGGPGAGSNDGAVMMKVSV